MNSKVFNSLHLKIVAMITMTIDHAAIFLGMNYLPINHPLIIVFRIIGRIALPLFAFLLAQAIRNTSSKKKYILQLSIMCVVISLVFIFIQVSGYGEYTTQILQSGNIFIDLTLGAVTLTCLSLNNKKKKLLALIPFIYTVVSYIVFQYEKSNFTTIAYLPYCLRPQYYWYFQILVIGFYYARALAKKTLLKQNLEPTTLENTSMFQKGINEISVIVLVVVVLLNYLVLSVFDLYPQGYELYAIIPSLFILFYNGKRGKYGKGFKLFSYLYYPLHLGILVIIFTWII